MAKNYFLIDQETVNKFCSLVEEGLSCREAVPRLFGAWSKSKSQTLKRTCARMDLSEVYNLAVLRDKQSRGQNLPNELLFVENSKAGSFLIRSRVLKDELIPYICSVFNCPSRECAGIWCGKEIGLEIDHINGVNNDHRMENLRFLCKICHGQTPTYAAKNTEKARRGKSTSKCPECLGNKPNKKALLCMKCKHKNSTEAILRRYALNDLKTAMGKCKSQAEFYRNHSLSGSQAKPVLFDLFGEDWKKLFNA